MLCYIITMDSRWNLDHTPSYSMIIELSNDYSIFITKITRVKCCKKDLLVH